MEKLLKIIGTHDQNTIDQMKACLEPDSAVSGVLCADGHLGYSQPVGGVVAYEGHVSVSGVGYDIACGNKAVKTNLKWSEISKDHSKIADQIQKDISFGVGKSSKKIVSHSLFEDSAWGIPAISGFKKLAEEQLSSCGTGNHYCDVFVDPRDNIWVGVHFGSRGLGHKTASAFLELAGGKDGINEPPTLVSDSTSLGQDYIACMNLAGKYAYAGRDYVCNYIVKNILKGEILDEIHNHHNFAWKENHQGRDLWVVRKGATPAFPNQRGFIGGSMGGSSVIIRGLDSPESKDSLYSTVHGAGRVMSRTQAAGKKKWIFDSVLGKKIPKIVSEGLVNETSMRQKIQNLGIELRGGGADEAPDVYRNLEEVLNFHAGTIAIETVLNPKIVVMAGSKEFDPYKD